MEPDLLSEIRTTFFAECVELLESLDDGLRALGDGRSDAETINSVFRAVHSIKGGAGAFGFDDLVKFAHRFETVMEALRSGRIAASPETVPILYRSADYLADLVNNAKTGNAGDRSTELQLSMELGDMIADMSREITPVPAFEPVPLQLAGIGLSSTPRLCVFQIRFTPYPELFASGNDPLFILQALADLGEISVVCNSVALPDLEHLDPQSCFLAWSIKLSTAHSLLEVIDTAAFVDGLCDFIVCEVGDRQDVSELQPLAFFDAEELTLDGHATHARQRTIQPLLAEIVPDRTKTSLTDNSADLRPILSAPDQHPTVRVDLERIDRLVNLVGELVINQSMLSQEITAAGMARNSSIAIGLEEFLHLSRNIQDSVMMIRAQPIKPLFSRMARVLRETAAETGKNVRLQSLGENTEIDKTLVERLAEPLTHMIRNAVGHGLEKPALRIMVGKPSEGAVTLSASHRSGRVIIAVSDDGCGIDRPKVVETAIRKGLISPDQPISDGEIDNLLFLPGFTTAESVSNLSGRGVGMDVVRKSIQEIGGRITIASERGKGTTFTISLPLTLAVLEGMIVEVGRERIVVPLGAILETMTLDPALISNLGSQRRFIRIRNEFVPLLDLGVELGYRDTASQDENAAVLLIAHEDGMQVAIVTDRIDEQRQVVIKGFERNYGRVRGIAAATILGDGTIALILDTADFVDMATGRSKAASGPLSMAG